MDFVEQSSLEKGFSPVFQLEVKPALLALEEKRVVALKKARQRAAIALVAGFTLAGLVLWLSSALFVAAVIAVAGIVGALMLHRHQVDQWGDAVAEAVMPAICRHVGDLRYDRGAADGFELAEMQKLGVINGYEQAKLSDRLEGAYRDTSFEMVRADLTRDTRDSDGDRRTETVFTGLVFRIGVPVKVPTKILIRRDMGKIGNKLGALFSKSFGMAPVQFDHQRFEDAFEAYAENPQAAKDFMPPAFLDNVLSIAENEAGRRGAKALRAGFVGNSFWLAVERTDGFLKMGKLSAPITEMEPVLHAIFSDIEMVHRIIDRLHGDLG